ncbi:MAG: S-formylglutathione hydrolase [Chromatiales bacterium]|nr:S-formylglutathione hydrolase [Chromatiales bacterium]
MEEIAANRSFGGWHRRYRHRSETLDCDMVFAAYLPPQADKGHVPCLWWLSGLTCTDENFMHKAGALGLAAQLGIAIICPDTSPRGVGLTGEDERYDFGSGAGFYLNATQEPWRQHYQMYDYVTQELPALVNSALPVTGRQSISGHSMGGHGALICALRNPGRYQSVSALAPIANPAECPWGEYAYGRYLGMDRETWLEWDSCALLRRAGCSHHLLVDQGTDDRFLAEGQLRPEALEAACQTTGVRLTLRMQPGYDHSYFFVASFIEEHLRFHAARLA